jgi:hypothetical protein
MASASKFLPPGFDPAEIVVVIAGKGRYPALLVECARDRGAQVKLISFEEETDPALIATFNRYLPHELSAVKEGSVLLALGITNIRIGPSLPAFLSPTVLNVLVEKFGLTPISTAAAALKAIVGSAA